MRGRLVAGNWKSNGNFAANERLLGQLSTAAAGLQNVECAVCVPYPYLHQVRQALAGSPVAWGGQDVSQFSAGAYTGAVTAGMLREFDCRYAIVGHSERRSIFGESNAVVAAKFVAALHEAITPIVCVGETLQERESGDMEQVVGAQLDAVIAAAGAAELGKAVIAYEPVWAIGTGKT
ncbi:MAG TPA: triose-phosphate isomerase, partial [Burkholderiales bacterium]|nr:triose-phosphate isomerase [Burkholderiales bacterium]